MNSELEEGLKAWLESTGLTVPIFTGFTHEQQPTDAQTVTIFANTAERRVGPLYRVTVNFIVATPPHSQDNFPASLAEHRETVSAIRPLLEDHDETTLKASLEETTSLFFHGAFLESGGDSSIEGGRWVTTMSFLMGVATQDIGA